MQRRFTVTADDFGVSPIIDIAIKNAIRQGVVHSVACFPNYRDPSGKLSMEKVVELRDEFPHVNIGCHFTITSGGCVSDHAEELCRKGSLQFKGKTAQHPARLPKDMLQRELQAQLDQFKNAGIAVSHFSDHMGILSYTRHGIEAMLPVIKQYVRDEGRKISMRNPVFIGCIRSVRGTCLGSSSLEVKAGVGAALKNILTNTGNLFRKDAWERLRLSTRSLNNRLRDIHNAGIPTADYFVESFYGNPSAEVLKCVQRHTPGKHYYVSRPMHKNTVDIEIMVHLASEKGAELNDDQYEAEIDALKEYDGVAIGYLRKKRVEEYKQLVAHLKRRFPASELPVFRA